MIHAVIIDVDDTLCMTEAACFALENEVLRRMNRSPISRTVHISTWGQPLFDAMPERSPGVDVTEFAKIYPDVVQEFVSSGRIDVIPEANFKALDDLIAQGKQVILLTSRTHAELKHMLEPDHDLARRVTAFYHKDNTGFHKPDPRVFDELFATHKFKPADCVYFGDSPTDAQAANGAGMKIIVSLESGLRTRQDFADWQVAAYVKMFPDIVAAVLKIDSQEALQ